MYYIKYNEKNCEYILNTPVGNQTFYMLFQGECRRPGTIYYNIAIGVYNKRKHANSNEDNKKITGTNPMRNAVVAIRAFKKMERFVLEDNFINCTNIDRIIIYCHWIDNRRRDAYYKVLSRFGYRYARLNGSKVIMKTYNKIDYLKNL